MDWVAKLLGLDPSWHNSSGVGGGIIMVSTSPRIVCFCADTHSTLPQGSASEACLTVCIAARERALNLLSTDGSTPEIRSALVQKFIMYGTTQTHSLGAKAGLILGIPFRPLETRKEDDWALRGDTLAAALLEDEAKGLIPFILRQSFNVQIPDCC